MILVDTSVWVKATQEKSGPIAAELDALIDADQVATTDIVVAEVLQGTSTPDEFEKYAERLDALHYFPMTRETWERSAGLSFRLGRQGLATPLADLAIATVALDNGLPVFAVDRHFERVSDLVLHSVGTQKEDA